MKIVKYLLFISILIISIDSIFSHRNHGHKNHHRMKLRSKHKSKSRHYDPSYSPGVIRDFITANFDVNNISDKNLVNSCLDLVTEDKRLEGVRNSFWSTLEKFATEPKYDIDSKKIKEYIGKLKTQQKNEDKSVECSDLIISKLMSDSLIDKSDHIDKLKNQIQSALGVWKKDTVNKNNKLITSFASYYRDSNLRNPDLFKRLNNRSSR